MKHELGEIYERNGEKYIKTENGTKLYHRYLVEKYLGFPIPTGYIVHHIDGDHSNNVLSNLCIVPTALHVWIHRTNALNLFASNLNICRRLWSQCKYENELFDKEFDKHSLVAKDNGGYWRISCWKDGKRVIQAERLHVITMMIYGQTTQKNTEIHHIDGDKNNNLYKNLEILTISEHAKTRDSSTMMKKQWKDKYIREKRLKQLENARKNKLSKNNLQDNNKEKQ